MSMSAVLDQSNGNNTTLDVHQCNICGKPAFDCCAACGSVWYCGKEHQREDWKKGHRNSCQTWTEVRDEKHGLHYRAKKDLMAGTRIFDRRPILVIPKKVSTEDIECSPRHWELDAEWTARYEENKITLPVRNCLVVPCLGCHEYLVWPHCKQEDPAAWDPTAGSVECSKCGWPVHNEACEQKHEEECKILSENKVRCVDLNEKVNGYDDRLLFIGVLRAVILKTKNPKDYETLMKMPYKKDRMLSSINGSKFKWQLLTDSGYGPVIEYCKWFVLTACKLEGVVSGEEVEKIHRILMENRFHCNDLPAMRTRYCDIIFDGERGRVFPHSCIPNCAAYIPADGYTTTFKTIVPVAAGEILTINYHDAWVQKMHYKGLSLDSRTLTHRFNYSCDPCDCPRCSDPTENGSMFSAVRCWKRRCNGYVLPVDVFDICDKSKWVCQECQRKKTLEGLEIDLSLAQFRIELARESAEHVADPKEKKQLIRQCLEALEEDCHPNHYLIFNTLMSDVLIPGMMEILSVVEVNSATDASRRDLFKFHAEYLKDFDHVLSTMEKVSPGRSMPRGYFEFGRCLLLISKLAEDILVSGLNLNISKHEFWNSKAVELDNIFKTAADGLAMFKEVPLADRELLKMCRLALGAYKKHLASVISGEAGGFTGLPDIFQSLNMV